MIPLNVRKSIEATYCGKATVIEYGKVVNEKTKLTSYQDDIVVLEKQPCRLSYEKVTQSVQGDAVANITQGIKLFISPDVTIKPNSKIIIEQNGITGEYTSSGVPAVYPTHQEIVLELYKERA